MGAKHPAIGM